MPYVGSGNPRKILLAQPLLYDALAIKPEWQDAVRVMTLATHLDIAGSEAVSEAVSSALQSRGIGFDIAPRA